MLGPPSVAVRRARQRRRPVLLLRVRLRPGDADVPAGRRHGPDPVRARQGDRRRREDPLRAPRSPRSRTPRRRRARSTYRDGRRTRVVEADYCVATIPPQVMPGSRTTSAPTSRPRCLRRPGRRPARSAWSTAAAGGRRTSTSTAASPRPTWTWPRSGTRPTATSASAAWSSATTTSAPTPRLRRLAARRAGGAGDRPGREDPRRRLPRRAGDLVLGRLAEDPLHRGRLGVLALTHVRRQYTRLLEPAGNVYFAGDYLSYYIAWQAGAVESARKVVMQLHDRVVKS